MRLVILIYYLTDPWNLDSSHDMHAFVFFVLCVFFMRDFPLSTLLPRAFHASNRNLPVLHTPRLAFDNADPA